MYSRSTGEVNSNRATSSLLRKWTRLPTDAFEVRALTLEVTDNYGSNDVLPCGAYGPWRMWWTVCSASLQPECKVHDANLLQVPSQATVACSQPECSGLLTRRPIRSVGGTLKPNNGLQETSTLHGMYEAWSGCLPVLTPSLFGGDDSPGVKGSGDYNPIVVVC